MTTDTTAITFQETDRPSISKAAGGCWIMIQHPTSRQLICANPNVQTVEVETGTTLLAYAAPETASYIYADALGQALADPDDRTREVHP